MLRKWALILAFSAAPYTTAALADAKQDCENLRGDAAIQACDEAIREAPLGPAAYYNRATEYQNKGDFDHAIGDYTKAIEIDPNFAKAYNNRGVAHRAKGEFDLAIDDYTKAIAIDPKEGDPYANRGDAYKLKGDFDHAAADDTKAIEIDPKDADAYNSRGYVYHAKGDFDRAIADYTKVIAIDPRSEAAYNNRGVDYEAKGDFDRASDDFTTAIENYPSDADGYINRCWLRATANRDLTLAFADCGTALRLAPNDANDLDSLGFLYLRLGRLDEAIANYDAALKANPRLAGSLYGRGLSKRKKGDQADGDADIAAARAIQADIADEYAKYGMN